MPATAIAPAIVVEDDELASPALAVDARQEDAYWARFYWRERYYRPSCDYEDYAPAYCVGYVGYGQYGGSFGDAEKSLFANWERIKGDSRLSLDEARLAMRAAWDRMEQAASRPAQSQGLSVPCAHPVRQPRWGQAANQAHP
jgi:hypothetical protein